MSSSQHIILFAHVTVFLFTCQFHSVQLENSEVELKNELGLCNQICQVCLIEDDCRHKKKPCQNGGVCDIQTGKCSYDIRNEDQHNFPVEKNGTKYTDNCNCVHQNTIKCDSSTGICQCSAGWYGSNCSEMCPPINTYSGEFKKNCDCQKDAWCSPKNGTCIHTNVSKCPDGRYGDDCSSHCDCKHGTCDKTTGVCYCHLGWIGTACSDSCPAGTYGVNCSSQCKCQNSTCDRFTGHCHCLPGLTGTYCSDECPAGTYGVDCDFKCKCQNGTCDKVTGVCHCQPGWTGTYCSEECLAGTYGANCGFHCNCKKGTCDKITGVCHCHPGWTGTNCSEECPTGTYGETCGFQCKCQNGNCNKVTGVCFCHPGWTGTICSEKCPAGTCGIDCASQCKCQNGTCDKVNGEHLDNIISNNLVEEKHSSFYGITVGIWIMFAAIVVTVFVLYYRRRIVAVESVFSSVRYESQPITLNRDYK